MPRFHFHEVILCRRHDKRHPSKHFDIVIPTVDLLASSQPPHVHFHPFLTFFMLSRRSRNSFKRIRNDAIEQKVSALLLLWSPRSIEISYNFFNYKDELYLDLKIAQSRNILNPLNYYTESSLYHGNFNFLLIL